MRAIPLILFLLSIYSCKKDSNIPYQPVQVCSDLSNNIDSINKYIHGKWNWAEDKYLDRSSSNMVYITPKTTGYIRTMNITDSTITFYKNYFIQDKYKYKVAKGSDIPYFGSGNEVYLEFRDFKTGNYYGFVPISICSEYLVFYSMGDPAIIGTYKLIK